MSRDNTKLSHLIHAATQEIIANTEKFIQSVSDEPLGTDKVSVMLNGLQVELNRVDYNEMKAQNSIIKMQMKKSIQELTKPDTTHKIAIE